MREHETDPRVPIPASDWDLARAETKDDRVVLTPSNVQPPYTPEPRPQFGYTIVRSMMRRSSGR